MNDFEIVRNALVYTLPDIGDELRTKKQIQEQSRIARAINALDKIEQEYKEMEDAIRLEWG